MAEPIKVAVAGYRGKVGSVLAGAFQSEQGIEYVGGVELGDDLAAFLRDKRPRALVDFTKPSEALHTALAAVAAGAPPPIRPPRPSADSAGKLQTPFQSTGGGGSRCPHVPAGAAFVIPLPPHPPPPLPPGAGA